MIKEPMDEVDYDILNYIYVDGLSIRDAARISGLTDGYIKKLLDRKEVRPLVDEMMKINEVELLGLEIKSTEILRNHLYSESPELRDKAVDKIFKRRGAYKQDVRLNVSAEDVIKRFIDGEDQSTEE